MSKNALLKMGQIENSGVKLMKMPKFIAFYQTLLSPKLCAPKVEATLIFELLIKMRKKSSFVGVFKLKSD